MDFLHRINELGFKSHVLECSTILFEIISTVLQMAMKKNREFWLMILRHWYGKNCFLLLYTTPLEPESPWQSALWKELKKQINFWASCSLFGPVIGQRYFIALYIQTNLINFSPNFRLRDHRSRTAGAKLCCSSLL